MSGDVVSPTSPRTSAPETSVYYGNEYTNVRLVAPPSPKRLCLHSALNLGNVLMGSSSSSSTSGIATLVSTPPVLSPSLNHKLMFTRRDATPRRRGPAVGGGRGGGKD